MATSTSYLNLILPGKGEYVDTWHIPVNQNMEKIDAFCADFGQELIAARGSASSLSDFLLVAHLPSGELKPTAEEALASSSQVYGYSNPDTTDFTLNDRIGAGDRETFDAREGQANLRAGLAARADLPNQIVSGSKDGNGYPAWMGFTANKFQIDGSTDPLTFMINGFFSRVRTLKEITVTGGAGTKYAFAQYQEDGVVTVDADLSPAAGNGSISMNVDNKAVYLNDLTKDFTALDVKPLDILEMVDGTSAGVYIVKTVAPGGIVSRLEITGLFPTSGISGINYTVSDPLGALLTFGTTDAPAVDQITLGEGDFDGAAMTAVRARHFKDTFVGEWRAVDVGTTPTFEEIYLHKLGSDELDFSVQVSTANDGSAPVEEMDLATLVSTLGVSLNNTLGVSITNGLIFTPGVFSPGTSDASYIPGSLTGTVTGALTGSLSASLTGAVNPERAVKVKWDKNSIWVKNVVGNVFYTDYDGNDQTVGFIRVVVRKRG